MAYVTCFLLMFSIDISGVSSWSKGPRDNLALPFSTSVDFSVLQDVITRTFNSLCNSPDLNAKVASILIEELGLILITWF